jgi:hypothetical protein
MTATDEPRGGIMTGKAIHMLLALIGGVLGGASVVACALFAIAHDTVRVHGIEIVNSDGRPSIAMSAGKNGEGRLNFYDAHQQAMMSLGLQTQGSSANRVPRLMPYESLGDSAGRSAITIAVSPEGKGVIAMGDNGVMGRLILGNIQTVDSGPSSADGPELWGLQVSGNPGVGRKFASVGLLVGHGTTQEVNVSSRGDK